MYLKDPTKRVQYTFRIKEDLMEDLKVYAKAKNMKLPRLLNNIIEEYLDGMNMSNTWANEPLHAIIYIPNELPVKYHTNVLRPRIDGIQYEVKAMPYNLDTWNDKYGYIANSNGLQHKGVEPLLIPSLIKDITLKKDKTTAQTIAQCLIGLYFTLHDNDQLHVELISHNNATGQLQFINQEMAKVFIYYRKMLYDIINDHLNRLNDVNHDKIKEELLDKLEDLAITINTGNVVPVIAPAEDGQNTLTSDNPHLTGNNFAYELTPQFDNGTIYEDMQNRIDELERENQEYKNNLDKMREDLNDMEARQKVWEDMRNEMTKVNEILDNTQPIIECLQKLEDGRLLLGVDVEGKPILIDNDEDKDPFKLYKEKMKKQTNSTQ